MTGCSLRRLQELAAAVIDVSSEVATPQATKESDRASRLSECQSNTGGTMTGCSLRRLQVHVRIQPPLPASRESTWGISFTLRRRMAENGSRG